MRTVTFKQLLIGACFGAAASLIAATPWGLMISVLSSIDLPIDAEKVSWPTLAWPALLKGSLAGVVITLGWNCGRGRTCEASTTADETKTKSSSGTR